MRNIAGLGSHNIGKPSWLPRNAKVYANFANSNYWYGNANTNFANTFTFTRASNGSYLDTNNVLRIANSDVARFDGGYLLIEPSVINIYQSSEVLSDADWTKVRVTINTNAFTAPDNNLTADAVIPSTANNTHYFDAPTLSYTAGNTYTISVFAKANGYNRIRIALSSASFGAGKNADFNVNTGTVIGTTSGSTANIVSISNGWFRCSVTSTATSSSSTGQITYIVNDDANTSFAGDGTSGVLLWGLQSSISAKMTSYMQTNTSASATREADVCTVSIPVGVTNIIYTFDDDSTQTISVSNGSYTIPTNLNRPKIKSMSAIYT